VRVWSASSSTTSAAQPAALPPAARRRGATLAPATADARTAAEQYRLYASAAEASWRAGFDSLLTLEQARRSAISAQLTDIQLQRDRVRAWIALYKSLGGGWTAASREKTDQGVDS